MSNELLESYMSLFRLFRKMKLHMFSFRLKKQFPALHKYTNEYISYLASLFARAANTDGFNYLCSLLRVEGITSGYWDAFVEAEEALQEFSKLLRLTKKRGQEKRAIRFGLLIYCYATEMSPPYEILANLLRCCQNKSYMMYPFSHLIRVSKKRGLFAKRHLPYPINKIEHIKELAAACGEVKLNEILDSFFNNDIRNAFYHSDYTISENEFRIIEGAKLGKNIIPLEELSNILTRCFAFYSAFFIIYKKVRQELAKGQKFHLWPNYEVLELLSDKEELTGFKIHFPNGSHAMFERKRHEGTTALNIRCEEEGISLMVGDLDAYKKAEGWFVEGKAFDEYGTRYNKYGYWRPIIFQGDSQKIEKKVTDMIEDKIIQGCLFYIYTTGHKAIEFVLKSNKELFRKEEHSKPRFKKKKQFVVRKCENREGSSYLYDGTIYLKSINVESIQDALEKICIYVESFKKRGVEIQQRLKYQFYSDIVPIQKEDGSFTLTLRSDDPRSILVASHLGLFPKSDWKIKEEWI